jgi:hypothetical protein
MSKSSIWQDLFANVASEYEFALFPENLKKKRADLPIRRITWDFFSSNLYEEQPFANVAAIHMKFGNNAMTHQGHFEKQKRKELPSC